MAKVQIKHRKKELFIEIDDKLESKYPEKIEADEYASETLIPSPYLKNGWMKIACHV